MPTLITVTPLCCKLAVSRIEDRAGVLLQPADQPASGSRSGPPTRIRPDLLTSREPALHSIKVREP
jgi:hypothetical protein